jgi:phosphatidylserine synthase 2
MSKGGKSKSNDGNSPKQPQPLQEQQPAKKVKQPDAGLRRNEAGHLEESDFWDFLHSPHTVILGIVLFSLLYFYQRWFWGTEAATAMTPEETSIASVKLGLSAAAWSFIVFGVLHLPDGIMFRPHPMVWRFFLSVMLLYMFVVIFALFQDLPTTRRLLGYYDPKTLIPLPEKSYAEDCRMSTPEEPYKFFTTVFDEFIVAHALGYWVKMIVVRDWRLVTAISLGFEVVEVTFQHILPNFKECWWDHVLADVLICNAGGTFLGWLTLRWFGVKEYRWVKLRDIKSIAGKARRLVGQLQPRSIDRFAWLMFQSPKRFFQVMLVLMVFMVQELNAFTMKFILNLAPTHHLVMGRIVLWGFFAVPGLREFYDFISDEQPTPRRIGTVAWVGAATLVFESLWILKMTLEGNYFQEEWPAHIVLPWVYVLVVLAVWVPLFFATRSWRTSRTDGGSAAPMKWLLRGLLSVMLWSIGAAFVIMFLMGNADIEWQKTVFDQWAAEKGLWPMGPEVRAAFASVLSR